RGIEPQRALTDHAAAVRLLVRSGTALVLGSGALLAGPELARGEPLAGAARIGRSIAAQAASAAWASSAGMPAQQVLLQGPFESPVDATGFALLLAELTVRRMLYPDHARAMQDGWVSLVGSGDPRGDGETARLGRAGLVPARMYAGPLGVSGGGEGG